MFCITDILHIRAIYQKCKITIIIIFNPLNLEGKLEGGVKYYISAFLIYSIHAKLLGESF